MARARCLVFCRTNVDCNNFETYPPRPSRIEPHPTDSQASRQTQFLRKHAVLNPAPTIWVPEEDEEERAGLPTNSSRRYLNNIGGGKGFGGKLETGKENPYSCVVLAGMRNQDERRENLEACATLRLGAAEAAFRVRFRQSQALSLHFGGLHDVCSSRLREPG